MEGLSYFAKVGLGIVATLLILPTQLAVVFFGTMIIAASWIMEQTMNVPIVRDSWALNTGWVFTRDLVNMLFIIILAWIGIATMLRLKEYQTGKVFMRLIIIALLVNFSPVLVGLVVDFSNIIANYFIQAIVSGGQGSSRNILEAFLNNVVAQASIEIWSAWGKAISGAVPIFGASLGQVLTSLGMIVAYGIWFVIGALIFFMLTVLFFLRVIAFWILLILAPIAFIAFILPQTRKFWDMWWHNLLQWAFVGIVAAFFAYLSFSLLGQIQQTGGPPNELQRYFGTDTNIAECLQDAPPPRCDQTLAGKIATQKYTSSVSVEKNAFSAAFVELINRLLPMTVSLIFLGIGLFIGFSSSAMGASIVVEWAKTKGITALKLGGRKTLQATKERVPQRWRDKASEMAYAKKWGEGEAGVTGFLKRTTATVTGYHYAKRGLGRLLGAGIEESNIAEVKRQKSEHEKLQTTEALLREARTGFLSNRVAAVQAAIEKKKLKGLRDAPGGLTDQELIKLARDAALRLSPAIAKDIIKAVPHLADQIERGLPENVKKAAGLTFDEKDRAKGYANLKEKVAGELDAKDAARIDKAALKDKDVQNAIHRFWSGQEVSAAAKEFGRDFVDAFMEEANRRGAGYYARNNQSLYKYLRSSGAQELGFGLPEGKSLPEEEIPPGDGAGAIITPGGRVYEPSRRFVKTGGGILVPEEEAPVRKRKYFRKGGQEPPPEAGPGGQAGGGPGGGPAGGGPAGGGPYGRGGVGSEPRITHNKTPEGIRAEILNEFSQTDLSNMSGEELKNKYNEIVENIERARRGEFGPGIKKEIESAVRHFGDKGRISVWNELEKRDLVGFDPDTGKAFFKNKKGATK